MAGNIEGWPFILLLESPLLFSSVFPVKNLTTSGGTVKLYAKWKPISYKIAYYPNGGEGSVITQAMTYNKAAYLTKNTFKRTGYMFLGWAKTATGAVAYKNAVERYKKETHPVFYQRTAYQKNFL